MGCEWLYAIHEEYGYLALRNICFQILSLLLLLTYVKDESDLLLYAWSTVASKVTALLKQLLAAMIVVTVPRLACLYGQKGGEFFQKLARQEKAALLAISIASVVNICLNFLLIPAFKEAGAALATLFADLVTCLACYFLAKKWARLLPSGKKLASSLLGCLYVYLVCQAALAKGLGPGATVFWAALWAIPGYFVILYLFGNRVLLEFKRGSRWE